MLADFREGDIALNHQDLGHRQYGAHSDGKHSERRLRQKLLM